MIQGKIFDKTPSGLTLTKKRDDALKICLDNGHDMGHYKRVNNKKYNHLEWRCLKCGHSLMMDFNAGIEKGGALLHVCRGTSWL